MRLIAVLFFTFPIFCGAQDIRIDPIKPNPDIESSDFDKFDSLLKVVTRDQSIGMSNKVFVKVGFFSSLKRKKKTKDNITLYVMALPNYAVSVDETSSAKIIFDDNSIKEYKNESRYKAFGEDEVATLFFTVPPNDPLRTKKIRSIRFGCKQMNIDADASEANKDLIIRFIKAAESKKMSFY